MDLSQSRQGGVVATYTIHFLPELDSAQAPPETNAYLKVRKPSEHVGPARSLTSISMSLTLVLDSKPWQLFHLVEQILFFFFTQKLIVDPDIQSFICICHEVRWGDMISGQKVVDIMTI